MENYRSEVLEEKPPYEEHSSARLDAADPDRIAAGPPIPHSHDNPFGTPQSTTPCDSRSPYGSMPGSRTASRAGSRSGSQSWSRGGSASSTGVFHPSGERYFRSRRVQKGSLERPWMDRKDPKEKWVTIIPCLGIVLGLIISGILIWDGLRTVSNFKYCQVLDENFSRGWNDKLWTKEVEVGGYGSVNSINTVARANFWLVTASSK